MNIMRMVSCIGVVVVLSIGASAAEAATANALNAVVTRDSVVFSGVTAGGEMVLLGSSIHSEWGTQTRTQYTEILSDSDGDGVVSFQTKGDVPFRSIWTAVDLKTGSVTVAAPAGYDLRHRELPKKAIKRDGNDLPVAIDTNRFRIFVLLVRPGSGAWLFTGAQGGTRDADRAANGRLLALFSDAQPIGGKKENAPHQLKDGDVIAMLDPDTMDLWTWTVSK